MLNAHLSNIALGVANVEAASRFYEDHLGLRWIGETGDGRQRLGLGAGAHVLELCDGVGLDHFSLEVADDAHYEALLARLRGSAVDIATAGCEDAGQPTIRFEDPDGHVIQIQRRGAHRGPAISSGARLLRLHHVTLTTEDVPALADFYVSVMGFAVSDRMADKFVWLRCNREHHTVAIVEGAAGGLDHYCYEIADWDALKVWCDELAAGGVTLSWGPGRHGPGNNLFIMFDDADGVHIELSCEMERFWDDRVRYGEPRVWSQDLSTVNLWGPTPEWRAPLRGAAGSRAGGS